MTWREYFRIALDWAAEHKGPPTIVTRYLESAIDSADRLCEANATLRANLAAARERAEKAEAEKKEIIDRSLDLLMDVCDRHKQQVMSLGEFIEATKNCRCRLCFAEKVNAALATPADDAGEAPDV